MDKEITLLVNDKKGNENELSLRFEHAERLLKYEAKRGKVFHKLKDKNLVFKDGSINRRTSKKPSKGAEKQG